MLFDTASDVFTLISTHDGEVPRRNPIALLTLVSVRRALYEAPENVATLIRVVTNRLFNLVSDHTFPTPPSASVTSMATSFIKNSTGNQGRSTTKEVLNCLRVLQRVLPVVFETEEKSSPLELGLFWKKDEIKDPHEVSEETGTPQFVIEDDDDEGEEQSPPPTPAAGPSQPRTGSNGPKMAPSMAERLFSCLVDLMFCCGFTLPTKIQVDHYKINYTIWYALPCPLPRPAIYLNISLSKGRRVLAQRQIQVQVRLTRTIEPKSSAPSSYSSPSKYMPHQSHYSHLLPATRSTSCRRRTKRMS